MERKFEQSVAHEILLGFVSQKRLMEANEVMDYIISDSIDFFDKSCDFVCESKRKAYWKALAEWDKE